MNLPLIQFAVYALAAAGFVLGTRLKAYRWYLLPLLLPALVYAAYYLKVFSEPIWLYQLRSIPGSELLAALAGVPAGAFYAALAHSGRRILPIALCALVFAPYIKFWLLPLNQSVLKETWEGGVCLQSTPSTCGPASAATLLRAMRIPITERELALESYSTASGTENWYLAQALKRRGVDVTYLSTAPNPKKLVYPAIAGTKLGGPQGAGHFILVLDRVYEGYLIADPISGRATLTFPEVQQGRYYFTGFFMKLSPQTIRM